MYFDSEAAVAKGQASRFIYPYSRIVGATMEQLVAYAGNHIPQ